MHDHRSAKERRTPGHSPGEGGSIPSIGVFRRKVGCIGGRCAAAHLNTHLKNREMSIGRNTKVVIVTGLVIRKLANGGSNPLFDYMDIPSHITPEYLQAHPDHIFVFGDNDTRSGLGGAAILRYQLNTYGFITKWRPDNREESFYTLREYTHVYAYELKNLIEEIEAHPDKTYLISKIGAGLANRFGIWDEIIEPNIKGDLSHLPNVVFLW